MKKYIIVCFLLLILPLSKSISQTEKFEQGKIILKFKPEASHYKDWLTKKRNFELNELIGIIGHHQIKPMVRDASLKLLNKKLGERNKGLDFNGNFSEAENLSRIAIIEYDSYIDPFVAARKISGLDFVEYAEPLPLKRIVGVPNDSLIYRQYYLNQIKIFDAWDIFTPDSSILIGIIDTGIDYLHEDLKDKIWNNPGESGLDNQGNDKRTNGIDDDENGFVDDWHGWDFVSSENPNGDNDPYPGHAHGSHVSGIAAATTGNIAGIAGIASTSKLLPVKVASDNPFSTSVSNSYEGILYAASMGADVINCSWGSESRSEGELEILTTAASLGSVIVAAAGNDGNEIAFFPAAHKDVISVASVDFNDERSSFSNYHHTVDIASPGEDIFSCIPNNGYDYMDGTSMASPVVAGVAALVRQKFPEYSPVQVKEHLKASSDNIDTLNQFFIGKLGRGRVNALKALQPGELKSVVLEDYTVADENNDNIFEVNEQIDIQLEIQNVLSPLKYARIETNVLSEYKPQFLVDEIQIGEMQSLEVMTLPEKISLKLPEDAPTDYSMLIELMFFDENEYINSEYISVIVNPSYRTMRANNISVTFNSRGNIAFNDYPSNMQGEGFKYKNSYNLLYEGALMVAVPPGKVSNVARSSNQMEQDNSFYSYGAFAIANPGKIAAEEGSAEFSSFETEYDVAVKVRQTVYQFDDDINKDLIIVVYDIINTSGDFIDSLRKDYDSLFAGLYFDWDLGASGSNNFTKFDDKLGFGYVKNMAVDTIPFVGVAMLSGHKMSFFAIDNPGETETNPGVWDGFTRYEKWLMLSSGIYRKESSITDVSMVIGAGPIQLKAGDTTRVAFSFFAGENLDKLRDNCRTSRMTAKEHGIADGTYNPLPKKNDIMKVYPNPVDDGELYVDFALTDGSYISIDVFNSIGQKVYSVVKDKFVTAGFQSEKFKLPKLAQGRYYLRLSTINSMMAEPFEVLH